MLSPECGPVQMFVTCVISPNRRTIKKLFRKYLKRLLMLCYMWDQDAHTNPLLRAWIGRWVGVFVLSLFVKFCFVFLCLELTYPYSLLYRNLNTGLARWFKSLMDTVFNPPWPTQGKKRIDPRKLSSDLVIYTVIQMLAPPPAHTHK